MAETAGVFFILFFSVILHEYAHGWVARRCGDPTAWIAGRLTLNPLRHIDPVGTIVVPFVLHLLGIVPLAWAKPVPVDFRRLRHPRRDMLWVALAGPGANIALALIAAFGLRLLLPSWGYLVLGLIVLVNLMLAFFNLTPIPPLDGSRILTSLLPPEAARGYGRLEPYGLVLVIVLLNLGYPALLWIWVERAATLLGVVGGSL